MDTLKDSKKKSGKQRKDNRIRILKDNEYFLKEHGKDIQANIFLPHKKTHSLYLFLNFSNDGATKDSLVRFFKFLVNDEKNIRITSFHQKKELEKSGTNNSIEPVFLNIYFTADGLEYFDCRKRGWSGIIDHLNSKDFLSSKDLNGKVKQNKIIHAVILLAHEFESELNTKLDFFNQYFGLYGVDIVKKEAGRVYRKKAFASQEKGFVVEHFGYADGLSNPWIRNKDTKLKNGKPKLKTKWDLTASIDDFITSEPSIDGNKHYGSYLVYRKFEQNVLKFDQTMEALSKGMNNKKDEVGALVFGRKKDGVPVELLNRFLKGKVLEEEYNNFDFKKSKCPFFAHIRKTNPRNHIKISMIRRGVTYGIREEKEAKMGGYEFIDTPEKYVGLLFFSFVKDINEFKKVLDRSRDRTGGVDPILGYINDSDENSTHTFEDVTTKKKIAYKEMKGLVNLQEGVNLYMPSIHFFQKLSFGEKNINA